MSSRNRGSASTIVIKLGKVLLSALQSSNEMNVQFLHLLVPCMRCIVPGTSSIVHESTHQPLISTLSRVVETVVRLKSQGHKVVLVSSGAIGVGLKRMEIPNRPKSLSGKQASRTLLFHSVFLVRYGLESNELHLFFLFEGSGSDWTRTAYCVVG